MEPSQEEVRPGFVLPMSVLDLIKTIGLGILFGALVAVGARFLNNYLFGALLCKGSGTILCGKSLLASEVSAVVLAAALTLVGLVYLRVFRPLLAVLAAALALTGFAMAHPTIRWYVLLLVLAGLYGLALGLFAWTARIRSFLIALIVMAVLAVLVRLVLSL